MLNKPQELNLDGNEIILANHTYGCGVLFQDGKEEFFKIINRDSLVHKLGRLEEMVKYPFLIRHPYFRFKSAYQRSHKLIEKEVSTIDEWKKRGLIVPEIIESSRFEIRSKFIRGSSYGVLLNGRLEGNKYDKLLQTFKLIRTIAKNENDKQLLHSDPSLNNFIYSTEHELAIPIDPGLLIRRTLNFDKINACMNLHFIYDLYCLDKNSEQTNSIYIERFIDTLEATEVKLMVNLNRDLNIFGKAYLSLREELISRIKNRKKDNISDIYSKKRILKINSMLEKVL